MIEKKTMKKPVKKRRNKASRDLEDRLIREELREIKQERKRDECIVKRKGWRSYIA